MLNYFEIPNTQENIGIMSCIDDVQKITMLVHNMPKNMGLSIVHDQELPTTGMLPSNAEKFTEMWNYVANEMKIVP